MPAELEIGVEVVEGSGVAAQEQLVQARDARRHGAFRHRRRLLLPGAAQILTTLGITLKGGDGHVMLAQCDASDRSLIIVEPRGRANICFRAKGTSDYLTMEISSVYLMNGGDHNLTATLTPASGDNKTYDVGARTWTSVGETGTGVEAALMEIRIA